MATYNENNPIRSVGGAYVPPPSKFQWNEEDASKSNAGRTEDGIMHKNRLRILAGIDLAWQNVTTAEASQILTAFKDEYVDVEYLDPKAGGYVTKNFYVGNRSGALYNAALGRWSNISFRIIER